MFLNMIMAIGWTVSKIGGGEREGRGSGHNDIDYNLLKMQDYIYH